MASRLRGPPYLKTGKNEVASYFLISIDGQSSPIKFVNVFSNVDSQISILNNRRLRSAHDRSIASVSRLRSFCKSVSLRFSVRSFHKLLLSVVSLGYVR